MSKKKVLSLLGLILVVVLWGIAPVISKFLFDNNYASPALLTAIRGLLSVIAMGIIILATGIYKKLTKAYWICVPAGLILGLAYLLQFVGLNDTTPAKNTFLESLSCITVPITMFILVKEKPGWVSVLAALACLFGSFVLCGNGWDFTAMFTSPTKGDILSMIAGIFFGIDIAFTKVFAKGKDPLLFVFFQLIILTIMNFAYAFPFEQVAFAWKAEVIIIAIVLGVLCTAVCWVLRTACIRNVSAVTCAVLMPMSAVIATLTSIIFKLETFSWNVIAGGLIITLSIVLSGIYDAKQEKKANKEANK
ncbi:MAG: DMT family transporter [Bacilli bacterium]|nr:DMT family transporter [Bacilli bacterium]